MKKWNESEAKETIYYLSVARTYLASKLLFKTSGYNGYQSTISQSACIACRESVTSVWKQDNACRSESLHQYFQH